MSEAASAQGKSTVVIKVIHADGTEETYFSDDVEVADAVSAETLIANLEGDVT